jgi:predicted DCC family thiol-disulfide oxidoreductase YuxK
MDKLPDHLVLFDGVCNLCNKAVRYIAHRDKKDMFRFVPLQSNIAEQIRKDHRIPAHTDSVIYFRRGKIYTHSTAALKIAKDLGGRHCLWHLLMIIPKPVRDYFYDLIARKRYEWFGKTATCQIPDHSIKRKFMGDVVES